MKTVADEVAHKKAMDAKFAALKATENEVLYLGQDAYVPRLVASSVALVKPRQEALPGAPGQEAIMYRPCYAEKPTSNRPSFSKGALKTRPDAEPHVFPWSTVSGAVTGVEAT
eukprot:CAMPEP_0198542184 /NCGR_PEP_ID=MMETSP1462-20131121/56589_1 /TAXON_ID=1333877 /ORGANISM="Brandtodinium nutriculum, Strain RCC3387" /LENGTH=112 /DNA_ID=CAMNT_0044272391 /DNA_START=105 /DNA_END=440 /DNA_ORIENTATION=+